MDLQILSKAQGALEEMQDVLYDLKEAILNGKYNSDKLTLDYLEAIHNLNKELRNAPRYNEIVSRAEKELNMGKLASSVYEASGLSEKELKAYKGRKRDYVAAKQIHMAMLHKVFGLSDSLAASVYGMDRTTALHGCITVRNLYQTDREYRRKYRPVFDCCFAIDYDRTDKFLKGED
jgi:chromosomal replication initiation ATPase DnaA